MAEFKSVRPLPNLRLVCALESFINPPQLNLRLTLPLLWR